MKNLLTACILFIAIILLCNSCKKSSSAPATHWNELGSGTNALNANGPINAMVIDPSGNIYVAGGFKNNSGWPYVAKWDGKTWSQLGNIKLNGTIKTLATDINGHIYAGGTVVSSTLLPDVIEWDGNKWTILSDTPNSFPAGSGTNCLATNAQGDLFAERYFYSGGLSIGKWDGSKWTPIYSGLQTNGVSAMTVDNGGGLYATRADYPLGSMISLNGVQVNSMIISSAGSCTSLDIGANYPNVVTSNIAVDANGNVYAAGNNSNGYCYIAKWNGSYWSPLDTGHTQLNAAYGIYSIAIDQSSNVYAAGVSFFDTVDYYVAKWDRNEWSKLAFDNIPTNERAFINIMKFDATGNLYAAGYYTNSNKGFVAKYTK